MNKQKVLITGSNGMLGSMLKQTLESSYEVIAFNHNDLDITKEEDIKYQLIKMKPNILINCAAYTFVDKAESEIQLSNLINGYAPGFLAKYCKQLDIKFIHISTDYVFGDNNINGHSEEDHPGEDQLNQYARSKRLGEIETLKNNSKAYIVRISWSFGPQGKNFIDTMLTLAQTKTELSIVSNEFGKPSYTKDIAEHIRYIIKNETLSPGYYHSVNEGVCTRYEEAKTVFTLINKAIKLNKINLIDYPRPAKIANYSILVNTKLPKLQNWDLAIKEYLSSK